MKTLKNEIKELAHNLRALKKELKNSNRTTGYADYSTLDYRKNEFRLHYLAYCWLKSGGNLSEDQFFDKYENRSKKRLELRDIISLATSHSIEIDKRKKSKKYELNEMRKSIKFKKLELKERLRKTGTTNYYSIETEKSKFRHKHLAYCLFKKKETIKIINEDTLILNSFFNKMIKKYKLETANKNGEFKSFSNFDLNKELKLLKERS